ncbi:unnamed protein product [Sphagnum balticum]
MEGAIATDLGDGRVQAVVLKQVEKMKMGMHHMQLHSEILDSPGPMFELPDQENVAKRGLNFEKDLPPLLPFQDISEGRDEEHNVWRRKNLQKKKSAISIDDPHIMENHEKLKDGDYVLGNKALANLVGLLNWEQEDDSTESSTSSTEDEGHMKKQELSAEEVEVPGNPLKTAVEQSPQERMKMNETWQRLFILCYFTWCQICANTDIVCYFFFVVVYVWNFKFLTVVFPATLFSVCLAHEPRPKPKPKLLARNAHIHRDKYYSAVLLPDI